MISIAADLCYQPGRPPHGEFQIVWGLFFPGRQFGATVNARLLIEVFDAVQRGWVQE
jgi:hypothetical protein